MAVGLESARTVEWKKWEPGKEYHKVLPIKNVSRFVQTLHWQQPDCPHFGTEFNGPVRLNPGVTALIGLEFKPSKAVDYTTELQFTTSKGLFSVTLKALSSAGHVQCQADLSFGSCAVNTTTQQFFQFANSGREATTYEWIVQPPFSISPRAGFIQPGQTVLATCYFSPDKACAYSAKATCLIQENFPTTMNVNGSGKYTFFQIYPAALDFGDVVVGSAQQMAFNIVNTSKVVAKIHIDVVEDCMHSSCPVFTLDPAEAVIQPNDHFSVKVLYSPLSAGSFSMGQIIVTSSSQCGGSVTCTGYAQRPSVSISTAAIDFGSSPLGSNISRSFSLFNMSKVHVSFQFMVSAPAIYHVHPRKGVIRPESTLCVNIEFRPREARNYYKRIFCIVQDQHPFYCDLVGCCYLDKVTFPTLQLSHIAEHRKLLNDAVHGFQSASFAGSGGTEASNNSPVHFYESSLDLCASVSGGSSVEYKTNNQVPCFPENFFEQACTVEDIWEEYFSGRTRHLDFVEVAPTSLEFGVIPPLQKSEKQEVVVINNSETTVFCLWQTPDTWPHNGDHTNNAAIVRSKGPWTSEMPEDIFQISPQEATLSPKSSITFHVTFAPSKENQFCVETLDLCIFQKHKENAMGAPCQASIQVSGNSFNSEQQKFLPQASLFPRRVIFPPALQGSRIYQTVALRNQGCTPLRFFFDTSSLNNLISVEPAQGLVEEKSFQLVSIRFEAGNPGSHIMKLPCILNDNLNEKEVVILFARSDILKVELEESSVISFMPTNVGVTSDRTITLRNWSSIPAMFNWKVPTETSKIFNVKPGSGIILGNQQLLVRRPHTTANMELQSINGFMVLKQAR